MHFLWALANQSLKLTAEAQVETRSAQENEFLSAYTPPG
jgi:hypothetical protein